MFFGPIEKPRFGKQRYQPPWQIHQEREHIVPRCTISIQFILLGNSTFGYFTKCRSGFLTFSWFCTNNITAFRSRSYWPSSLSGLCHFVLQTLGFYVISTFELFGPILIRLWTIRPMSLWSLGFSNLCYFDFLTFGHFAKVNFVLWTFRTNVILDFLYFRSMSLRPSDLSDLCHFGLRILILCYVDLWGFWSYVNSTLDFSSLGIFDFCLKIVQNNIIEESNKMHLSQRNPEKFD